MTFSSIKRRIRFPATCSDKPTLRAISLLDWRLFRSNSYRILRSLRSSLIILGEEFFHHHFTFLYHYLKIWQMVYLMGQSFFPMELCLLNFTCFKEQCFITGYLFKFTCVGKNHFCFFFVYSFGMEL